MIHILCDEKYKYDAVSIFQLFIPHEKPDFLPSETNTANIDGDYIVLCSSNGRAEAEVSLGGEISSHADSASDGLKHGFARALYSCFEDITGLAPGWGILTGVRPAKLMRRLLDTEGEQRASEIMHNDMLVSDKKLALCRSVAENEGRITSLSAPNSYSLYVSVPFCPTKCSYCSFVSNTIQQAGHLIPDYLEKLCEELEVAAEAPARLGLKLETIYIGGGTPGVLTAEQLDALMGRISACFDISSAREYTVELGRPDVITAEKLQAVKENGAGRVSINPQTMNADILQSIGRRHTPQQTIDTFAAARDIGLTVNMDLIAGLPHELFDSFKNSIDTLISLSPENITVHTLALKRAAGLDYKYGIYEADAVGKMVDYAYSSVTHAGYEPYYMYRQKRSPGNHENVGYAKPGFESLYNVFIMDETHTILGAGAGAVTKLVSDVGKNIERVFNFKYPYEYINRFNELIERKSAVAEFYNKSWQKSGLY